MTVFTIAVLLAVFASLALHLASMGALILRMTRRRRRHAGVAPRISILKPLAGADEDLRANLESFAHIDYPAYEVLFGVADDDDPAATVARAFFAAHPEIEGRLLVTDRDAATNPKVAQLLALERAATGDVLVISDSNVRVGTSYLFDMMAELDRDGVGIVSSVVAGTGERSVGAAIENLHLVSAIAPSVVFASMVSRRPPTVGKSMAMRRRELHRLGGFAAVGDVLAEDHMLGQMFLDAGWKIAIALSPVENRNVACSVSRTLERHTRWAKMRRAILPRAFWLEPLLEPVSMAAFAFVVSPSRGTFSLLVGTIVLRMLNAAIASIIVRGRMLRLLHVALEPLRAAVITLCWFRAVFSRRVEWRGHAFDLGRDSRLIPVRATTEPAAA